MHGVFLTCRVQDGTSGAPCRAQTAWTLLTCQIHSGRMKHRVRAAPAAMKE